MDYLAYINPHWENIGPESITGLQKEHGIVLPDSYRNLLLQVNGGFCDSEDERFEDLLFFPIDPSSPRHLGFMIFEQRHGDRIPIALTLGGDLLYLDLASGEVFYKADSISNTLEEFFSRLICRRNNER
jgi:hypothetical protein